MSEGQDTEITLGTGRLLGLFFGLVIVCALFFGLGFSMGRNSVKSTLMMDQSPSATGPAPANSEQKSNPATPEKSAVQPENSPAGSSEQVSQTGAQEASSQPVVKSPTTSPVTAPPPELAGSPQIAAGAAAYTVQVAAVSKEEDAEALVSALRKKSYPVFVSPNSGDRLFHVQIGPFSDIKDAEAMKSKLTGDGYNPIVKR